MSNATYSHALGFLVRGLHCALMAGGLVAVAHLGSHLLPNESVGVMDVQAAAVLPESDDVASPSDDGYRKVYADDFDEVALSDEMLRVRDWVSRRYRVSSVALEPVLIEAESRAREADLDPLLIVAMIAVESSFNPLAESHMGAQGLMQVIPRWHMDKIGEDAGEDALFDPRFNVQVGTLVLVEGLQRYGSLQAALQYYGGARNDPEARYYKRVLAMKQRLASAARVSGDA